MIPGTKRSVDTSIFTRHEVENVNRNGAFRGRADLRRMATVPRIQNSIAIPHIQGSIDLSRNLESLGFCLMPWGEPLLVSYW